MAGRKTGEGRRTRRPDQVRPTQARVRVALYQLVGSVIPEARVLDVCAGTGALGLGALELGAGTAVFVERDARRCRDILNQAREAGHAQRVNVLRGDAPAALKSLSGQVFQLVLMDPPYGAGLGEKLLAALDTLGLVAPGGVVVVESHHKQAPPARIGALLLTRARRYGETQLSIYVPQEAEKARESP